uniref:Glyco_tran_10_N domain-containing protein n=1 Tax=Steinernema glaseri TaxID=37863 RepID=A0A1I7Z2N1_9BILA
MDRVPILFMQEVLQFLEHEIDWTEIDWEDPVSKFPSTWGTIEKRKGFRKPAALELYIAPNMDPVFFFWSIHTGPHIIEPFANLDQVRITKKLFPFLLRFVSSESAEYLRLTRSSGAVSNRTYLKGVLDALQSSSRRQKFNFHVAKRDLSFCLRLNRGYMEVNDDVCHRHGAGNCVRLVNVS